MCVCETYKDGLCCPHSLSRILCVMDAIQLITWKIRGQRSEITGQRSDVTGQRSQVRDHRLEVIYYNRLLWNKHESNQIHHQQCYKCKIQYPILSGSSLKKHFKSKLAEVRNVPHGPQSSRSVDMLSWTHHMVHRAVGQLTYSPRLLNLVLARQAYPSLSWSAYGTKSTLFSLETEGRTDRSHRLYPRLQL
jgi:hypothetical protein